MNKKFFVVGMAAILGASLSFFACDSDAGTDTVYKDRIEMIKVDVMTTNDATLKTALDDARENLVIGFYNATAQTLSTVTAIPAGKTVYILGTTTMTVPAAGLTVEGTVYVGLGATLNVSTSGSTVHVPGNGRISVMDGGTLFVANAASVDNGASQSPTTVLDKSNVSLAAGATLKATTFGTVALAQTFFDAYVKNGTLEVGGTAISGTTPSTLTDPATGITGTSATRRFKATAAAANAGTATTLTIPVGMDITAATGDTLASVETLTVKGSLTAAGASFALATGITISIGDGAVLIPGTSLAFAAGTKIDSTGTGYILAPATAELPKILHTNVSTTNGFTVRTASGDGVTDVDIGANLAIPAKVKVVITGTTAIAGTADITVSGGDGAAIEVLGDATLSLTGGTGSGGNPGKFVTVSVPVTVKTRGTLTVTGGVGQAAGLGVGGAATVEKVSADYGSNITVTGGAGGAGASSANGGAATIGDGSDNTNAKRIAFTATWATTNVIVTGGAAGSNAAGGGTGGAATLYTSNTIKKTTPDTAESAIIDHVTLTATGGALSDGGTAGTVTISDTAKSISAGGGSNGA